MKTVSVNPLTRVEGHGRVDLHLRDGKVDGTTVSITEAPRLFEGLVLGRDLFEVPALVSRICAICSAVHRVAACRALERALDIVVPPRAGIIRELLLLGGHIESHGLHLFCLVLPDLEGGESILDLLRGGSRAARDGLALKALGNRIQELAGGRAIHPVNVEVGGVLRDPEPNSLGTLLKEVLDLRKGLAGLLAPFFAPENFPTSAGPVGRAIGVHPAGGFSLVGKDLAFGGGGMLPGEEYRRAIEERPVSYSNARRSMIGGDPPLAGALARLMLAESTDALRPIPESLPQGIHGNNAAQAAELVWCLDRAVGLMEKLLAEKAGDLRAVVRARAGVGTAVVEAPRGLLIHHYVLDDLGRVAAADIVTPTAINQAAMEAQLLVDLQGRDSGELVGLAERIVRAYDPCISCSVHLLNCPP